MQMREQELPRDRDGKGLDEERTAGKIQGLVLLVPSAEDRGAKMKVYYWISSFLFILMCAYIAYKYFLALQNRPRIQKNDILYQEWFASGCSTKNILTQFGGWNNCVRLVITKDLLWVTSWFPFSLLTPAYDMEHVIPLRWITEVESKRSGMWKGLSLTYIDANGASHTLKLVPRNEEDFLRAIGDSQGVSQQSKSR
jgi:hypothetical protein